MLALTDPPGFPDWIAPVVTIAGMLGSFVLWIIAQQGRQREAAEKRHVEARSWVEATFVRGETFEEYRKGIERQVAVVGAIHEVGQTVNATYDIVRRRFPPSTQPPGQGG